jgi:hypothetical protein
VIGAATGGETHHYSIWNGGSGDVFSPYFDANLQYWQNGYDYVTEPYNVDLYVGGELTSCKTASGTDPCGSQFVSGEYDANPAGPEDALAWQRYSPATSGSWIDVQSAYSVCNGYSCGGDGGWVLENPPGIFDITYDH